MAGEMFCPIHGEVQAAIKKIEAKQDARKCLTNESDIKHLQEAISEIKDTDDKQWTRINKLQWYIAMGVGGSGVLAFIGSIVGAWFFRK